MHVAAYAGRGQRLAAQRGSFAELHAEQFCLGFFHRQLLAGTPEVLDIVVQVLYLVVSANHAQNIAGEYAHIFPWQWNGAVAALYGRYAHAVIAAQTAVSYTVSHKRGAGVYFDIGQVQVASHRIVTPCTAVFPLVEVVHKFLLHLSVACVQLAGGQHDTQYKHRRPHK